jgi:SagB-type dehydrogenase family enzyme
MSGRSESAVPGARRQALPPPRTESGSALEQAIAGRRSRRSFHPDPLSEAELGQLLWAAQGVTGPDGLRAAPSAVAAYPLELYVARAEGLARYLPDVHALEWRGTEDLRRALREAAHDQESVTSAPAVFVFTAVYERSRAKLGPGAEACVHMDLGHAAENLLLQAQGLGLAGVPIAWFDPGRARETLGVPSDETPVYLVPVGRPDGADAAGGG